MPSRSKDDKENDSSEKRASAGAPEEIDSKLNLLGSLATTLDYWRLEPSSLLFTNLSRADQAVKTSAGDFKKVIDGWSTLTEKVQKVRTAPKIKEALGELMKLSSGKNPWRLISLLGGFIAFAVLMVSLYVFNGPYFIYIVIGAFVLVFGLQFYGQSRLRKLMNRNVEGIRKYGATMIEDLSETCKDLAQTVINTLTYELPKYGKGSDSFTLRLISNDYANVNLRLRDKPKKGRTKGDLYSVVWK
ncbi:MAG: hypothetical protein WED05_12480 [Candidatus Atabeyarchaeum deiterrae]